MALGRARDVRAGVYPQALRRLRRVAVELSHGVGRRLEVVLSDKLALEGGGQDAGAQGLGDDHRVPLAGAVIGQDLLRMHRAGDTHAVLGFVIGDGVAPRDGTHGLGRLVGASGQDLPRHLQIEAVGETQQIQGKDGLSAHGIDVGDGIGRGDLSEEIGIVHHGWEEVHRLHNGDIV